MPEIAPLLIDYHCHLDLYPDYEAQYRHVAAQRIETLAVTTTPQAWPRNQELAAKVPSVRVALGLHPQLVGQHSNEITLFERYLPETLATAKAKAAQMFAQEMRKRVSKAR